MSTSTINSTETPTRRIAETAAGPNGQSLIDKTPKTGASAGANDEGIIIDPEFRKLIPELATEERKQLEDNLKAHGCRDPLVLWRGKNILLDGHNRYEICQRNGIAFKTIAIDVTDREAAADWIDANQLGRRNLKPEAFKLIVGRRYLRAKAQGERTDLTSRHNGEKSAGPAEKLARQHGVSKRTVERAGQYAAAIDTVKKTDPDIEKKVKENRVPHRDAVRTANLLERGGQRAQDVMAGKMTIAQAERDIAREEKRRQLVAKADAAKNARADNWKIINGDCVVELEKQFKSSTVPLIFADPPYNAGIDYGTGKKADELPDEKYVAWCAQWIAQCVRVLTPDGSLWLLISDEYADHIGVALRKSGLHRRSWLIWYETFGQNCSNNFNRCARHLFYCVKNPKRFTFNADAVSRPSDRQAQGDKRADPNGKILDNVWGGIPRLVGTASERIPDFPTQLPVKLLERIVGCASDPGDLVLDPFAGSATTGEACLKLGRHFVGIEKSKKFAAQAELRLKGIAG
jgi:DNA modification methylase